VDKRAIQYLKIFIKRLPRIKEAYYQEGKYFFKFKCGGVLIMSEKELLKEIEERAKTETRNYWNPEPGDVLIFYAKKQIESGFDDGRYRWIGYDRNGEEIILPTSSILSDLIDENKWYFVKYEGKIPSTKHKGWSYNSYLVTKLTDEEIKQLKLEPGF